MKAAVLHEFGLPLSVETVPDPVPATGDVIVDVVATAVLPYADEVFRGERRYLLTLPVVPGAGAVGRIRSTGHDATHLAPGDWVLCDPTIRSRDGAPTPDITLQGWSARGEGGLRLQRHFGNGSFAQQMLSPTENVTPIGEVTAAQAGRWCGIGQFAIPYGGLRAGELRPGDTVLISGATGNLGSTAVAVALAMGAGCVIAAGRNVSILDRLRDRFGPRVRTVRLCGEEQADHRNMLAAVPSPIDLVLDLLPPAAGAVAVRAAAMTVREGGRVVLMGGVGMLGGDDLALPYPWLMRNNITIRGQWMYPPHTNHELVRMVRTGLLDLDLFETTEFTLDEVAEAVTYAAAHPRGFHLTTLHP